MAVDCSIVTEDAVQVIFGLALYVPTFPEDLGATKPSPRGGRVVADDWEIGVAQVSAGERERGAKRDKGLERAVYGWYIQRCRGKEEEQDPT